MKRIPVDSSMIAWVAYDQKEKTLEVEFINTGHIYQYFNVPRKVHIGLMEASSKGSYMRDCIIDCYAYAKVKRSRYRPVIEEEEQTIDDFAGRYSIFTIESMEEEVGTGQQAFIQINTDGSGEFGFGTVRGNIRGKVQTHNGETMYKFMWQGKNGKRNVSGDGWLLMDNAEEVEGELVFFDGDEYYIRASRAE